MTLLEWMTEKNITAAELSRVLGKGATVFGIRKWLQGQRLPRKGMQSKIRKLTKGKVTPNDWIKDDVD